MAKIKKTETNKPKPIKEPVVETTTGPGTPPADPKGGGTR